MDFLFEIIAQFVGEILLEMLFEALLDIGLHSLTAPINRPAKPLLSTIGFLLWGSIAGGASLWILPRSLIVNHGLRALNLIITPVILAYAMVGIGAWRLSRGQKLAKINRFPYAFAFAFTMTLIRYAWAG